MVLDGFCNEQHLVFEYLGSPMWFGSWAHSVFAAAAILMPYPAYYCLALLQQTGF